MELKEKGLTIEDKINNLDGDKKTRIFILNKSIKNIPEGTYTKNVYYAYKNAMYEFIKGILSEKEKFNSLYGEFNEEDGESPMRCQYLKAIEERIESLEAEFDSALEKLGNWAMSFKDKRKKMRTLPNEERLNLMIHGIDYSVLEIVFEEEGG